MSLTLSQIVTQVTEPWTYAMNEKTLQTTRIILSTLLTGSQLFANFKQQKGYEIPFNLGSWASLISVVAMMMLAQSRQNSASYAWENFAKIAFEIALPLTITTNVMALFFISYGYSFHGLL